jgi:hypothetical protein
VTDTLTFDHSIEHFAGMCAALDGENGTLARLAIDDTEWHTAQARWLPVLASGGAPDVAARFARAYALARLGEVEESDRTLEMVRTDIAPVLPFKPRDVRAGDERGEVTVEVPVGVVRPKALPFARFDTQTGLPLLEQGPRAPQR